MKNIRLTAFALSLILTLGASVAADAKEMRYPETGDVFVSFDAPEGWTSQNDAAHNTLSLMPAATASAADIQVMTIGVVKSQPPLEMTAANFNKVVDEILRGINSVDSVKAAAFSSKEDMPLSGMTFSAFNTAVTAGELSLNVKLIICADAANVVAITAIGSSKEMTAAHKQILQSVKLSGVSSCALNEAAGK